MTTAWYTSLKENITELNASGITVEDRIADCQELLVADPEYGKDKLARLCQQYGVQSETTNK